MGATDAKQNHDKADDGDRSLWRLRSHPPPLLFPSSKKVKVAVIVAGWGRGLGWGLGVSGTAFSRFQLALVARNSRELMSELFPGKSGSKRIARF